MRAQGAEARAEPVLKQVGAQRAATGVAGLDARLEGGFPLNRAIVICGEAGTGKSTLCLQFLAAGLRAGEPGICVSVDDKPRHLLDDVARFGWQLDKAVTNGNLTFLDASPYFTKIRNKTKSSLPIDASQIATDLSHQVARSGARRLVIDSLTSLVPPELTRAHVQDYLRSLILSLEDNLKSTVLLTCRASSADPLSVCDIAQYLVSGVIELRVRPPSTRTAIDDELRRDKPEISGTSRLLFVKKMRGTNVPPEEYPFEIGAGGLELNV